MLNKLLELRKLATRGHTHCEDSWYSCPKSVDGCSNADADEGDECNCSADRHNLKVEALFASILEDLTQPK